jgi:hypothetical protein
VHDVFVRDVAIGEDDLFHAVLLDQIDELLFGADGDAARVQLASQLGRIEASLDIRDLGRGEGYDLIIFVAAKERVEIVEVTSCRAHNKSLDWHRMLLE